MNKLIINIKMQLKNTFSRDIFKFILFIHPIINALIIYMIYKDSSEKSYIEYAFLGTGLLSFWSAILFSSASDIERERNEGTLAIIFISPTNFFLLIFSKLIGNIILGLIPIIISSGILFILRPIYFSMNIFEFLINFILAILNLTLLSVIFSFSFAISKNTRLLMNNLEYPLYIVSGLVFPIEILPIFLQKIAKMTPLYWINRNFRNIINNSFEYKDLIILFIFLGTYAFFMKPLYLFFMKKIKIKGSI
ncbi:MAG: ABC transporter permease, partial [Cetobacterium sp.]|uniref:ABC transporter permease n=1 Tax=Cetobacterium sp. TaxID=2071632 RepID=UPI003EE7798A